MLFLADTHASIAIVPVSKEDCSDANELGERLGLPVLMPGTSASDCARQIAVLQVDGLHLSLQQTGPKSPGPVTVDFGTAAMRYRRRGGHNELLGRAVGVGKAPHIHVLDATAGLGRDGFVLADLGCSVLLCERHPVIAELLRAGLQRAERDEDAWLRSVVGRMGLFDGDVRRVGRDRISRQDVIFLDPMFPPRNKRAAVKKELSLLQSVLAMHESQDQGFPDMATFGEQDAPALLRWALAQTVARVVVKRPPNAPPLADVKASHCLRGKAVRYDVYVLRPLQ